MNFLINCSNIKKGGGIQVANSICRELNHFSQHRFIVVLSTALRGIEESIKNYSNITIEIYDIKNNISTLLLGRDSFLDQIVKDHHIQAVLTLFGPSRWRPQVTHLCGFARAHLILKNSPYFNNISFKEKIKLSIWTFFFKRSSNIFYTENPYISKLLPQVLGKDITVYTVTNYYHQIFDAPKNWKMKELPYHKGCTLLCVTSNYPHKNLPIMDKICDILEQSHKDFHFQFVLTLEANQCLWVQEKNRKHFIFIGKVDISECPHLYQQADIMFMPTLLECFTATYPEAMRMDVPIVTTDLEFARGLCGDAACYYSAVDANAAAEAIFRVATEKEYAQKLIENGKKQLLNFDNYKQRAEKLIGILEDIAE